MPFRGDSQNGRGRGGRGGGGRGGGRGGFGGRGGGRGGGGGFGGRRGGPQLPSTMLDEVDKAYGAPRRTNSVRSRGDERKEKRQGGPNYNSDRRDEPRGKRRADPQPASAGAAELEPPRKKPKPAKSEPVPKSMPKVEEPKKDKGKEKEKAKKSKELVLPEDDGDLEDREIKWLEYMLKKEGGEDSDGLDGILDFADLLGPGGKGIRPEDLSDDSGSDLEMGEDEEEFDISDSEGGEDEEEDESEDEEKGDEGGSEEETEEDNEVGDVPEEDEEEWGGIADSDAESPTSEPANTEPVPAAPAADDSEAPVPTRYVPPHLRAAQLAEKAAGDGARAAERAKLERKAQGLLNKLSEANIESILAEVEKLFSDYSRNDVTTTLTSLVIQMIGSKTNLLDSFVVLYATLVGALHRVIGLEFGAHFLQTLVKKYHEMYARTAPSSTSADEDDVAKEAFNLLTLIAELFNAGVVGSQLVYDLVRGFIGNGNDVMSERSVEGLLKILKCSGSQLRSDDPSSLKDIVSLVQDGTRGKEKDMTTRTKFMIETLGNLRSGKTKGLGAERPDVTRMRKFLSGLGKKRRLLAPEPLRVSLKDLLSADSRGKWWLVGAGWSGNPLVERQESSSGKKKVAKKTDLEDEEVLLDLARKQGMNTDVRRSAFVVLLTSEDYVHACDRLNAFKLTDVQQREFVRVTLHCCGMEKTYNPYYTLVLNNLCANSYDHRFTLQYALWDMLRELADGSIPDTRASNIARTLAFLIARGSVDLTILKAVEFTDITKPTKKFLDVALRALLLSIQTSSPLLTLPKKFKAEDSDLDAVEATFDRALSNPELSGGLAWVLQSVRKTPGRDFADGAVEGEVIGVGAEVAAGVLARAI